MGKLGGIVTTKLTRSRWLLRSLIFAAALTAASQADAAFIAYICDDAACAGGNDTIVTDNGPGDNFPGSAQIGQINSGALNIGGFTIVTNVSQSKPLIGSADLPQLDLTFSAVTSDNASHTIFLYAVDTGFTLGTGQASLTLGGTQSNPGVGSSVQGRAWGGATNANTADPRGVGPLFANTGSTGASPFALSAGGLFSPTANPYALSIGIQISRATAGTTTGDLNLTITPVPEPASIALLGTGLLAIGVTLHRRRSGKTQSEK